MRMADNVLGAGVVDWHADVLQVHFGVAQPWLQSGNSLSFFMVIW
jgi:hypothetical protein